MCRQNAPAQNEATADAPARGRGLSMRQHAAARYLARGYGSVNIARHLGINRHTIGRWKRQPDFIAELERLRREMTAAIVSPAAKATPPPKPLDALASFMHNLAPTTRAHVDDDDLYDDAQDDAEEEISDEEAAETEAWIQDVIRAQHDGREIPPPPPLKRAL